MMSTLSDPGLAYYLAGHLGGEVLALEVVSVTFLDLASEYFATELASPCSENWLALRAELVLACDLPKRPRLKPPPPPQGVTCATLA